MDGTYHPRRRKTPDDVKRDIKCPRRRILAAMIKKVVAGENTRHHVNGRLPEALSSAAIFAYYFHHLSREHDDRKK